MINELGSKKMKIKNYIAPLMVITFGAAMVALAFNIKSWHKLEPTSFPLNLRPGISQSPKFVVDLTTDYEILVSVERMLPFQQINCLLGIETIYPDRCNDIPSLIEMRWAVFSDGAQVAEGNSNQVRAASYSTAISRNIGDFSGQKGKEYIVKVESLRDVSILKLTNPQFKIKAHPRNIEKYFIIESIIAWLGLAVGIGGFIYLLIRLCSDFYRQRKT